MSNSINTYKVGASGIPVDSTLAGKNTNESYLALKNFSRIVLSTDPTALPNCPCGFADIFNPLGNGVVYIGGLDASGDTPYLDPFNPNIGRGEPLYPGTSKTFRVTNLNLLQATATKNGNQIQATAHLSQQDFQTPTNDPPPNPVTLPPLVVLSTNPVNTATSVPTNTVAFVVLSRNVDNSTVTLGSTVTIAPAVTGMTSYVDPQNPGQINFDPHTGAYAFTTSYTITVTTSVKDVNGTSLASNFSYSFTTAAAPPPPDTTPPSVQSQNPGNGATGVAISVAPVVYMNEAIQSAPVNSTNITLKDPNGQALACSLVLGSDNRTITITPNSALKYGSKYTVTTANQKDIAGNVQSPSHTNTFTTLSAGYTIRYNVAEGSTHTGSLSSAYELGPSFNGYIAYGEQASVFVSGQNLIGYIFTKVSIPHINTHGGNLAGSLTVEIRSSTAALRYAFANSVSLTGYSGSNTPAGPIVIQDPNNSYKMVNGDVILVRWLNPGGSGNLEISTADNNNPPYGKAVFWNGSSSSYTFRSSDDLAATISSTP
jgi:hypothetical protein